MTNFSSLASAAGLSGTQYKLRYEQSSCRLELTGLPDVTATASAGQPLQQLNILTGWDLNLGQKASLQGKREHLQALVSAVQPYVRLLVSAQPCQQSGGSEAVWSPQFRFRVPPAVGPTRIAIFGDVGLKWRDFLDCRGVRLADPGSITAEDGSIPVEQHGELAPEGSRPLDGRHRPHGRPCLCAPTPGLLHGLYHPVSSCLTRQLTGPQIIWARMAAEEATRTSTRISPS